MKLNEFPEKIQKIILEMQKNEITEYNIYTKLAKSIKNKKNSKILERIGKDELKHCNFWKKITGFQPSPKYFKVLYFYLISRLFGLTFGIKLMEKGEEAAQERYSHVLKYVPGAQKLIDDEEAHETKLINMLDEERLEYIGSIVLGLNDALVELTGALAGLTFALQNTNLIALTGLITGIAASFSMAASEYLSNKSDGEKTSKALKSSLYTGIAYVITVFLLIIPFLLKFNVFVSLGMTLSIAILIIFAFNYYISVAKDYKFMKRFLEMSAISLGVALLSFGIGVLIKYFMPISI